MKVIDLPTLPWILLDYAVISLLFPLFPAFSAWKSRKSKFAVFLMAAATHRLG